ACLLLPAVSRLRAATGWTLVAIPGSSMPQRVRQLVARIHVVLVRPNSGEFGYHANRQENLPHAPQKRGLAPSPGAQGPESPESHPGNSLGREVPVPLLEPPLWEAKPATGKGEPPPASSSLDPARNIAARNDPASPERSARSTTGSPKWRAAANRWGPVTYG